MSLESHSAERILDQLRSSNDIRVVPYHCLLSDLNGMDDYDFLQRLQKSFNIRVARDAADARPAAQREFGLYLAGYWYHMTAIAGTWFFSDPVKDLDVSILRDNMLNPVLGIEDCAQSGKRLDYIDGDQHLQVLSEWVDAGRYEAAIVLFAPSIECLKSIAELGRSMPAFSFAIQTEPNRFVHLS